MKKKHVLHPFTGFASIGMIILLMLGFVQTKAQYTSTWALTANKNFVVSGAQASGVTAGAMVPGTNFPNPGSHNTDGYQCIQTVGNWPDVPTDGYNIDFPLSPAGSVDATITGVTCVAKTSGGSGNSMISLAYQADGAGPWVPFGTAQAATSGGTTNISFAALTTKFYSGHTYVVRMYVYGSGTGVSSSRNVRIKTVVFNGAVISPAGTQPTVTTNTAVATGKYTGTVTGTLTAGTLSITASGVCWSTTAGVTIASPTKTTNGPVTSGAINANLTGLNAGITYFVRAYATSEAGNTVYGTEQSFTTNPPSIAALTTVAASNILSTKATTGGNISDSGGIIISAKGVCWNTTGSPTTANSKTNDGFGGANFSSLITGLTPSTTYYVRAYATNAIGTAYGNEITFTTAPPTPIIIANPTVLAFGNVAPGSSSQLTYSLSGSVLSPASGNITITAPPGYLISLTGSGFASSITVPYTGGTLPPTTVYIQFTPTQYGAYTGTITHSGGGATAVNIDNVTVTGTSVQPAGDVSNMGTDFWLGYGFHANMTSSNNQEMVLYFSAKQNTNVTVEIPSLGYTQTYAVAANVATVSFPLPKSGAFDSRLNATGITAKGIHVYSSGNVPIAVWEHIYASQSSGATMVLPTNTWGTEYTVLTTGGQTNSGVPHSFFFVQAAEDNTVIDIVPAADITAAANGTTALYTAGTPFSVILNKGDVFNALGRLNSSSNGVDLTGTTVKARDCKKIAVFTGNGRVQLSVGGCSFTNGGSDNLIQQMFPKVAWGSSYLTVPFKTMEAGFYRICVQDPATQVKVNGVVLPTSSLNQFYYQIENDIPNLIESDKPVMVAQYCASNSCNGTGMTNHPNTGQTGDPEMVILSPIQQAINDVTVYSAINYSIQHNFINVIIKNSGVSSFTFDGTNASAQFVPHPQLSGYSYAVFEDIAGNTSHRLQSTEPFNAIAYGFSTNSTNESYGYNAGTNLKDLTQNLMIQNPYGIAPSTTTCKNMPFKFRVAIPYASPDVISLIWNFSFNSNLSPNVPVTHHNPVADSTYTVDGRPLYVYTLPVTYQFLATGVYSIKLIANVTSVDGCSGAKEYNFDITVLDGVIANYTVTTPNCLNNPIQFTDASNGQGTTLTQWLWDFGNSTTGNVQNPVKTYTTAGTYSVKLRSVNNIGCYADVTKPVVVLPLPTASFTSDDPTCVNNTVHFTSTSTGNGSTINAWNWTFHDATTATGSATTKTYTAPGTFDVKLKIATDAGCLDSITKQVNILGILGSPAVTVSNTTFNSITFQWTAITGATGYEVSVNGGAYQTPSSGSTGLTHIVNGLAANQTVTITVRALGTLVCQENTGLATGTTILPSLDIFVPNTFTPNGDGQNDILKVYGNNIQTLNMMVFSQWGEKVFETKDPNQGWDGTYKGKQQPVGVYVYVVQVTTADGKIFSKKGSVNLIR